MHQYLKANNFLLSHFDFSGQLWAGLYTQFILILIAKLASFMCLYFNQ